MNLMLNSWRRRIGFICPSVLETTIPNFTSFAPEGVGLCAITSNIRDWDKGEFETPNRSQHGMSTSSSFPAAPCSRHEARERTSS